MTGRVGSSSEDEPAHAWPILGTTEAPRTARHAVLTRLQGQVTAEAAADIALVVGELVTNSVRHAEMGADDTVLVEIALAEDRLRIAVTDPGSAFAPRLLPRDPTLPRGFGLQLVADLCACWGVRRTPSATQVWCELPLGRA